MSSGGRCVASEKACDIEGGIRKIGGRKKAREEEKMT